MLSYQSQSGYGIAFFIDYSYSFTDIKMNYYQYKVDFKTKKQYI